MFKFCCIFRCYYNVLFSIFLFNYCFSCLNFFFIVFIFWFFLSKLVSVIHLSLWWTCNGWGDATVYFLGFQVVANTKILEIPSSWVAWGQLTIFDCNVVRHIMNSIIFFHKVVTLVSFCIRYNFLHLLHFQGIDMWWIYFINQCGV